MRRRRAVTLGGLFAALFLVRFLVERPTFLGVTSYAVYVLHSPLSSVLNSATRSLAGRTGGDVGAPWLGIVVLAALLAGAWFVDRHFDMPVRRLLGRVIPRTGATRIASP